MFEDKNWVILVTAIAIMLVISWVFGAAITLGIFTGALVFIVKEITEDNDLTWLKDLVQKLKGFV